MLELHDAETHCRTHDLERAVMDRSALEQGGDSRGRSRPSGVNVMPAHLDADNRLRVRRYEPEAPEHVVVALDHDHPYALSPRVSETEYTPEVDCHNEVVLHTQVVL